MNDESFIVTIVLNQLFLQYQMNNDFISIRQCVLVDSINQCFGSSSTPFFIKNDFESIRLHR